MQTKLPSLSVEFSMNARVNRPWHHRATLFLAGFVLGAFAALLISYYARTYLFGYTLLLTVTLASVATLDIYSSVKKGRPQSLVDSHKEPDGNIVVGESTPDVPYHAIDSAKEKFQLTVSDATLLLAGMVSSMILVREWLSS